MGNFSLFMVPKAISVCLLLFFSAETLKAQIFTPETNNIPSGVFGDYDNDGDLDILGRESIYRNDDGTYTEIPLDIGPFNSDLDLNYQWVDLDQDNDLDIFYSASDGVDTTFLLENVGNDTFNGLDHNLPGGFYEGVVWGDMNGDSYMDLVGCPLGTCRVFYNDGRGSYHSVDIGLPRSSKFDLGDYDNDNDLDLLVYRHSTILIFQNHTYGFIKIDPGIRPASVKGAWWGDFNPDGFLDIILLSHLDFNSNTGEDAPLVVYGNKGENQFEESARFSVLEGSFAFGDIDGNGYLDFLAAGEDSWHNEYEVLVIFTEEGKSSSSLNLSDQTDWATIADIDNDNDLDILGSVLYRNNSNISRPDVPTGLEATQDGSNTILSWDSDSSFTYTVFIHSEDRQQYVIAPGANIENGITHRQKFGNNWLAKRLERKLPMGTYSWGVQAVNAAYAGSLFAKDTFVVEPTADFQLSSFCTDETITVSYLGDSSTTSSNQYYWDFGQAEVISGSGSGPYQLAFPEPGSYTISCAIENSEFATDTLAREVILYARPTSNFNITESVCSGDIVTLEFTGESSDSATYVWDFKGAKILSGSGSGPYELRWDLGYHDPSFVETITLEVIEPMSNQMSQVCRSSITEKSVTVHQRPTSDFGISAVCEGDTATIYYYGNASGAATFNWEFHGATVVSGDGAGPYEVLWEDTADRSVFLTVTENGCSSIRNGRTLRVYEKPVIKFDGNTRTTTCSNYYHIKYAGENTRTLEWDFGDATILSSNDGYKLAWDTPGTKYIYCKASNEECSVDSTLEVTVYGTPKVPEIYVMTVDEETSANMIVWTQDSLGLIDHYEVYKEFPERGYMKLREVEPNELNTFIDTISIPEAWNISDPDQLANRYKIVSVATCLFQQFSTPHKAVRLDANVEGESTLSLTWNAYEGFSYASHRILRSINGGEFELLSVVDSNITSYTDPNGPISDSYTAYQIEIFIPDSHKTNLDLVLSSTKSNIVWKYGGAPKIYKVTIDSSSDINVVWEYPPTPVERFGIYREESSDSGEYELLEYIEAGPSNSYAKIQMHSYVDASRATGGVPKYKVTAVINNQETPLSTDYHQPMLLSTSLEDADYMLLNWTKYEGNFEFDTYRILRSIDGADFELIAEVDSTKASFTDSTLSSYASVAYQVEILNAYVPYQVLNDGVFNSARSNIVRAEAPLGLESPEKIVLVFPNPTNDYLHVNPKPGLEGTYTLFNLAGQEIASGILKGPRKIDLTNRANGTYILHVHTGSGPLVRRVVKR